MWTHTFFKCTRQNSGTVPVPGYKVLNWASTYRVPSVWKQHRFVLVPGHKCSGTKCEHSLRQAGPQNASNSIFKRKQRNLLDNSPHSKEAQSRIRPASTQTRTKGQLTRQTNKPPRHVKGNVRPTKHMVDCNDVICTCRICPLKKFFGGAKFATINYRPNIPRKSISTALWKRPLTNAMRRRPDSRRSSNHTSLYDQRPK